MLKLRNKGLVLVTGGTGMIGTELVPGLIRDGFNVRVLTRNKNKVEKSKELDIVEGDILDKKVLKKAVNGVDYVVHLAVYQNVKDRNYEKFYKVNVQGTKMLLKSLLRAKIKKFLYVSTVMVFESTSKIPRDEKWKKRRESDNYYVRSKLKALEIVDRYIEKLPIVVVYPTTVIERGVKRVPGKWMCLVGNRNRIINYVYLDELVKKLINVLHNGKIGEDYILGGENMSCREYLKRNKVREYFRIPNFLFSIIMVPPEDMCFSSNKINSIGL